MTTAHSGVLVVGAGPTGLVLAILLAQNGVPVRIIDKELAPMMVQRGSGIHPRTFELYTIAGLDAVYEHALKIPPRRIYGPGGIEVKTESDTFTQGEPTPAAPFPATHCLGQGNHTALLRQALARYGVEVEMGTELASLTQDADGVDVYLSKKGGQEASDDKPMEERSRYQWIVGADGGRSKVRGSVGLTFLGDTREDQVIFGDATVEGLGMDYWHMYGSFTTTMLSLRPTETPNLFQAVVTGKELQGAEIHRMAANTDALIETLHKIMERKDVRIKSMFSPTLWTPNIRIANKFANGRVFLAGDAAHIHAPAGGQGLNSGIQDAFNLAWKLAFVYKGFAPASLLESYDEERRPVIAHMLGMTTDLLNKMVKDQSLEVDSAVLMLGINYRWSSLVVSDGAKPETMSPYYAGDGELRAGDRAPQAPGLRVVQAGSGESTIAAGTETSLFQLLETDRYTALVFAGAGAGGIDVSDLFAGAPAGAVRKVVVVPQGASGVESIRGGDVVVVDEGGHAYRGYRVAAGEEKTVVIRPDGYIGTLVKNRSSAKLGGVF